MSNFANDRHALYVGWVVGLAWKNGLDAEPIRDAAGDYTDRLAIRFDHAGTTTITFVVPPPPDDWEGLS